MKQLKQSDIFRARSLTPRERDVLACAAAGKTSLETAAILGVSVNTVVTHLQNAAAKLGAGSKIEAVIEAVRIKAIEL